MRTIASGGPAYRTRSASKRKRSDPESDASGSVYDESSDSEVDSLESLVVDEDQEGVMDCCSTETASSCTQSSEDSLDLEVPAVHGPDFPARRVDVQDDDAGDVGNECDGCVNVANLDDSDDDDRASPNRWPGGRISFVADNVFDDDDVPRSESSVSPLEVESADLEASVSVDLLDATDAAEVHGPMVRDFLAYRDPYKLISFFRDMTGKMTEFGTDANVQARACAWEAATADTWDLRSALVGASRARALARADGDGTSSHGDSDEDSEYGGGLTSHQDLVGPAGKPRNPQQRCIFCNTQKVCGYEVLVRGTNVQIGHAGDVCAARYRALRGTLAFMRDISRFARPGRHTDDQGSIAGWCERIVRVERLFQKSLDMLATLDGL